MPTRSTHVDVRLALTPCEYATVPAAFARQLGLPFHVPEGGDERSCRAAQAQHLLVGRWLVVAGRTQADLARELGVSKQTVNRTILGQRWLCATVGLGLYRDLEDAARRGNTRRPQGSGPGSR